MTVFFHAHIDELEYMLRIAIAALCGGIIGFERSRMRKEAGLRTHIIVAVGAALLMVVSKYGFTDILDTPGIRVDGSRVAANVITGISFLGAGVIFVRDVSIKGLTTAAGLWSMAGVGLAIGAGMYARATDEEMEETQSMVEHARTSENFFKRKNLEEINSQIENLYQALEGEYEVYTSLHYYGQEIGSRLKSYSICRISQNPEYAPGYWSNCRDLKKCGKDEIEIIISGLEQVRKAFAKRIDTYLKKYGTSKVNAWSYIRD